MRQSIIIIALVLGGCSGAQTTDWTSLASEATPTFKQGKCGAELVWTKDLEVYSDVEVEGQLTIRKKCPQ